MAECLRERDCFLCSGSRLHSSRRIPRRHPHDDPHPHHHDGLTMSYALSIVQTATPSLTGEGVAQTSSTGSFTFSYYIPNPALSPPVTLQG